MLLQPGGWSSAFLEAAAAELTTPAGAASTDVLHATLLQGERLVLPGPVIQLRLRAMAAAMLR